MTVPASNKLIVLCIFLALFSIYFMLSSDLLTRAFGLLLFGFTAYIYSKGFKRMDWW